MPAIKTVTYHKVADYAAWKKGFNTCANERRFAGELSAEVSALQDAQHGVHHCRVGLG